jgi:hypothetical protein
MASGTDYIGGDLTGEAIYFERSNRQTQSYQLDREQYFMKGHTGLVAGQNMPHTQLYRLKPAQGMWR